MTTFTIVPDGPFSLEAAAGFGFGPNTGRPLYREAGMKLAFTTDDFSHHAEVALSQDADGAVTGCIDSDGDTEAISRQVARILSLDHSGTDWLRVGDGDVILGGLQRQLVGVRPVLFHSPYEAAAWSIISARRQRAQGTAIRNRLAAEHGRVFGEGKETMFAFPTPTQLLGVREAQGLDEIRIRRLHAIAKAALSGELDPARLLALGSEEGIEQLTKLEGIGPFYATLILLRSTGATDLATGEQPRMGPLLGHFYGMQREATEAEVARIMDGWRPFRTWCSVLMRVAGERLGLAHPGRPERR